MSTGLSGGNRMKILQINTVCGTGSTGRIAADIHKMLIEQGHESIVAYGRGTAYNCDNTIKIGNNLDFYKHVLKTRILDKHGFGSKKLQNSNTLVNITVLTMPFKESEDTQTYSNMKHTCTNVSVAKIKPDSGTKTVDVPWARKNYGFTLLCVFI